MSQQLKSNKSSNTLQVKAYRPSPTPQRKRYEKPSHIQPHKRSAHGESYSQREAKQNKNKIKIK